MSYSSHSDPVSHDHRIADVRRFITPANEAVEEITRRRNDAKLVKRVTEYLNDDIPEHFRNGPILYLSRHVATPSYATLRFIELAKPYGLPLVIGQDINDLFVSNNALKRSMAKMAITKGVTRHSDEIIEHFTILDFSTGQGKPFKELKTTFGDDFVSYHTTLLHSVYPEGFDVFDESPWVDRHHRGDLLEHYKKLLTLLVTNGIMFEWYEPEDHQFVKEVLTPAFEFVNDYFGHKPLICDLIEPEIEDQRDWNSYPSVVYKLVKNSIDAHRHSEGV